MFPKKHLLIYPSLIISVIPMVISISCTNSTNTNISENSKSFHVLQYEPITNNEVKNYVGNTYSFSLIINAGSASINTNGSNPEYYRDSFIDYITDLNGNISQYNPNAVGPNDWYSKTLNLYAASPFVEYTIILNKNIVRPW